MRRNLRKSTFFSGLQRMPKEEIADFRQTVEVADSIGVSLTVIRTHHAMPEKPFQGMQDGYVAFTLNDDEFRQYLVARGHFGMPGQADMEAALSVHESDNPISGQFHRNPRSG
jgi:hypothetical protein